MAAEDWLWVMQQSSRNETAMMTRTQPSVSHCSPVMGHDAVEVVAGIIAILDQHAAPLSHGESVVKMNQELC